MNKGIAQVERAEKAQQEDKHTPGPWTRGYKDDQTIYSGAKRVASVICAERQWEANARLIAAAPDMLKALKTIEAKLHEGDEEDGSDDGEFIQDVRNLNGDYIGQLSDLGAIARGAIAVAAQ